MDEGTEQESKVPLADLVNAVRAELEAAAASAREKELQFEVQDVQLEVEVTATATREGEGGLKLWVLTIGGKRGASDAATHKVTLKLSAVSKAGNKFRVSDLAAKPLRRS